MTHDMKHLCHSVKYMKICQPQGEISEIDYKKNVTTKHHNFQRHVIKIILLYTEQFHHFVLVNIFGVIFLIYRLYTMKIFIFKKKQIK